MKANHAKRIKRAIWDSILKQSVLKQSLAVKLHNFEYLVRSKAFVDAFESTRSFAHTKAVVYRRKKHLSVNKVTNILTQRHETNLRKYFGVYRAKIKVKTYSSSKASMILKKIDNANLRHNF